MPSASHPVPVRMNAEERAARAEALAAELDSALSLLLNSSPSYGYTASEVADHRWRAQRARLAWEAHRADLDTLGVR